MILSMSKIIRVAHDFSCPWCWIGWHQAQALQQEFGVTIQWWSFELWPDSLELPEPAAPKPAEVTDRPATPSRMELAYAAQGMTKPRTDRPSLRRTHNAHEALAYARTVGKESEFAERLYRGYWESALDINFVDTLAFLATGLIEDVDDFKSAIASRRFADEIVGFDDDAYAKGVYNVPTFFIGDERYAEQPLSVLREATREFVTPS